MDSLSDSQVDLIYDLLISKGLSYDKLRDELLDHICCIIENQMEAGVGFYSALKIAEKQFGPSGIERTEEGTLYLLTLKQRKMKKTASIFGVLGGITTIFGTVFKVMHWPMAGVLLLLGLAITALLFMPTALFVNLKSTKWQNNKTSLISGFLGGIILIIFSLFKIFHWPGASALFIFGLSIIVFIFIPVNFIKNYRNPENKWFDIGSLTVVLSAIILVFALYNFHGNNDNYFKAIETLEKRSISSYIDLENEVAKKSAQICKQHPEKAEVVEDIQSITNLLVAAFQQYRNSIIDTEYQLDDSDFKKKCQMLNLERLSQNSNWQSYFENLKLLLAHNELENRTLSQILASYNLLSEEITGQVLPNGHLNSLAQSIQSIPSSQGLSAGLNMVYLSYLNMAEFEAKQHQAKILENM